MKTLIPILIGLLVVGCVKNSSMEDLILSQKHLLAQKHLKDDGTSKNENKAVTPAGTPVPIVEEGEFIVVNPAGSTRYLMVEILLVRKDSDDNGFPAVVKENRKRLEAQVSNVLSAMSAEEMSKPSSREGMPNRLKKLFQSILGSSHPIDKVIIPKWVMQ